MKRGNNMRKTILIVIGLLLTLSLFACVQPISEVVSLEVENWPTDDLKTAGTVDLADVNVIVNYNNGAQDTLSLDQVDVQSDSIDGTILTVNFGTNTVKISYGGLSIMLTFQAYPNMITVGDLGTIYSFDSNMRDNTTVTGGYKLSQSEVTYAQWYSVRIWAEEHGYDFTYLGREGNDGAIGNPPTENQNEPVTYISWTDAIIWLNALSEMVDLEPVYRDTSNNIFKSASDVIDATLLKNVLIDETKMAGKTGYRLPTINEWEMAARWIDGSSWTSGDFASGQTEIGTQEDYAWYGSNANNTTHEVETKLPNQLNLFDMTGNVFEWCYTRISDSTPHYVSSRYYKDSAFKLDQNIPIKNKKRNLKHSDVGFRIAQGTWEAATAPLSFTLSLGDENPASGTITQVVAPINPYIKDDSGKITDYSAGNLKFTVIPAEGTISDVKITYFNGSEVKSFSGLTNYNGVSFNSPANALVLIFKVTTMEEGKEDCVYYFNVALES